LPLTGGVFGAAQYVHGDAQGSIDAITAVNATTVDTAAGAVLRDPFGRIAAGDTLVPLPAGAPDFPGRPKDETGLSDFRARLLDTDVLLPMSLSRFISRDLAGFAGGLNPYTAFDNDPTSFSDPSGTTAISNVAIPNLAPSCVDTVLEAFGIKQIADLCVVQRRHPEPPSLTAKCASPTTFTTRRGALLRKFNDLYLEALGVAGHRDVQCGDGLGADLLGYGKMQCVA